MDLSLLVLLAAAMLFLAGGILLYNRLIRLRTLAEEGWSGVDAFLQQRSDLIPNLVETVKGYAAHESQVLTEVARWRSQSLSAASLPDRQAAMLGVERSLAQVLALAEQYPELKADRNFARLQDELSGIEEQLNMARRYYNGAVRNLNVAVQSFPGNLVAGLAGISPAPFFEAQAQARQAPRVDFSGQAPRP